jgi:hypothetical protein
MAFKPAAGFEWNQRLTPGAEPGSTVTTAREAPQQPK